MTSSELPESGTIVELTAADDPVGGVRVIRAEGPLLTLSMPMAAVPASGATITIRWPAGARGRYALAMTVRSVDENRIDAEPTGPAQVEQNRNYVRGGGGEPILLRVPGHEDAYGWIRDISEQGVRAHFGGLDASDGEKVTVLIELDNDIVELHAVVAKVAQLRQRVPPGPMSVELVAIFLPDEAQARIIRRYVMRQQVLNRART
ncbi:MAG: hypothetical protein QOE51_2935 [Actinoplanes sp.]|jgi:hypothetical protein|nr:hypothetical protein [Actinoplanes sp.]